MKSIRIGGVAVEPADAADVIEVEPGVFSILDRAGRSYEVLLSQNEAFINGQRFSFEIDDPRRWKRSESTASGNGSAAIVAPMPGKVVRFLVAVGDQVESGQGIVVVEAMKMQNELKSPRAGVVGAVKAAPDQSVNAGAVLVLIESIP